MKAAIIFGVITLTLGSLLIWQGKQEDKYCIEQWLDNTQDLFQSATAIFASPSSDADDIAEPREDEALDEKLQALLPVESSKEINWQVQDNQDDIAPNQTADGSLLPNLFNKTQGSKTTVSGQLHLDDSDNIVGAEVNVEIPTN